MVYKIYKVRDINLPVSRLRCVTAQFAASLAPSLFLFNIGTAATFATIAIPELLNAPEGLSLNNKQASWFGSVPYLSQPIGALVSGIAVDYFGRKKTTLLVTIPHIIAWILMYFAWNLSSLFTANVLLGVGIGLMGASINSYISEISEPSLRGTLATIAVLFFPLGISAIYLLGAVVNWRVAALICLSVTIIAGLLSSILVPDTPIWLLSQGREKESLKSLCYLRGWTTPENVREEFEQLVEYSKNIDSCVICYKENKVNIEEKLDKTQTLCKHYEIHVIKRFFKKFRIVMLCQETLRPMIFGLLYIIFYMMSGLFPIRPYMINICGAMGMSDDGKTIVVMVGIISFMANIIVVVSIKYLGKRKLGITATLGSAICSTILSVYAGLHLNNNVFSYDAKTFPKEKSFVPLIAFYGLTLFTTINVVSWIVIGEIFPFRCRASCQGILSAWTYLVNFAGAKSLLDLEIKFKLTGVFAIYAIFAYVGTTYLYIYMPETEGKQLQEIESFYSGGHQIFANDWFINKFKRSKTKKDQIL